MTFAPEIEPVMPSDAAMLKSDLPSLAMALERKAARLSGGVSDKTAHVLEDYLRVVNSYYSNLIEGHSTHPREIRKAMRGDYSADPAMRDLQKEALAHMYTQQHLSGRHFESVAALLQPESLQWIHRIFYERLPEEFRVVLDHEGRKLPVEPGQFRQQGQDVNVGRHLAPSPDNLNGLLKHWAAKYGSAHLRGERAVISAMAAHHRLLWIHPFLDGNGRVGRLLTDQFLRTLGVGGVGLWCLSRGLARSSDRYKEALARADFIRQGSSDGRGALSERELIRFCGFMLTTAIDQVEYMEGLLGLNGMSDRIRAYVEDRQKFLVAEGLPTLRSEAYYLLERAFIQGEVPRSEVTELTGLKEVTARRLVKQLKDEGLLTETSSRSPLRWAIPDHAERYFFRDLVAY